MRRFLLLSPLLFLPALLAQACDLEVEFTNAPPVATWLQASEASDGIVDVTVWVYDLEQEPVDLEMTWSLDGEEQGAITLAPGGHGVLGLTTVDESTGSEGRPDPDGQPHLIRWSLPEQVTEQSRLQLHIVADDRVSTVGPMTSTSTEGFLPADGVPTVVALSAL